MSKNTGRNRQCTRVENKYESMYRVVTSKDARGGYQRMKSLQRQMNDTVEVQDEMVEKSQVILREDTTPSPRTPWPP